MTQLDVAREHVLVTGAVGLIGAAICRRLTAEGVPFTAVWHDVEPHAAADKIQADLADPGALSGVERVSAVVHAAAVLPGSFEDSERAAELTRRIDDHVLRQATLWGARLVYISGTAVYRPRGDEPLDESAELAPAGPYLEEKARTEEIGLEQAHESGVPFTVLRVSAPYGPGQRARTVIQRFVERAIAGQPLEYFGTGSREQDFTWADDVADAIALALGRPGGVFNIASGRPVTMRALAETVAATAGLPDGSVRAAGRPDPQEGATARFAVGAAARELGWSASTPLAIGIERLLEAGR